jgi:hypothetical protein
MRAVGRRRQREARGEDEVRAARGVAAGGRTRGERLSGEEEDGASCLIRTPNV